MIYHNRLDLEILKYYLVININLHTKYYTKKYASIKCSIYPRGQEEKNGNNRKEAVCAENSIITNSHLEYHLTCIIPNLYSNENKTIL